MNFSDRLHLAIQKKDNPTVLGLDPQLHYIPQTLLDACQDAADSPAQATGLALIEFNRRLMDAVFDLIPAIKLQSAFYEQYGLPGISALQQTIDYAHQKGLIVIVDAKRNDIGSTAEAYARAYLSGTRLLDGTVKIPFDADALTVNGYLGFDGIEPFLKACQAENKGIFILVRTSNPSAREIQDLPLSDGRTVCEAMADFVSSWGRDLIGSCGYSSVGAVVGATWPDQALSLRLRMPEAWILVPGYGAQGGTAEDAALSFGKDGSGALVNASRSLMLAFKKQEMPHELFDVAARKEALMMRQALKQALNRRNE